MTGGGKRTRPFLKELLADGGSFIRERHPEVASEMAGAIANELRDHVESIANVRVGRARLIAVKVVTDLNVVLLHRGQYLNDCFILMAEGRP